MTKQQMKAFLSQAYRIDRRIDSKLEQIISLRELTIKATATLSETHISGNRHFHSMEDCIAKIVDLENEVNRDISRLIELKRKIMAVIKLVEHPEYQTLLELRYLCFKTWEETAVAMGYDLRYVHKLHGRALESCSFQKDTKRHRKTP